MAAEYDIDVPSQNAMIDSHVDLFDAGAGAAYIEWRTGARPATCATADSGTLLATTAMSDPACGAGAAGVATANAISDDSSVDADGTVAHFRIKDSDGTVRGQGNVGLADASATFDGVEWVETATVTITSFTFTMPAGT